MFDIGRICMKIAGRDAGKLCVVIDKIDDNHVLIDGQTRRRKCNVTHLELIDKSVEISKNAPNSDVIKALKEINIECKEKKDKEKKEKTPRPKKVKKQKVKQETSTDKSKKTKSAEQPKKPVETSKEKVEQEKS